MENIKKTQAQRDNTYPLFGNGELAELISHDPMKILEIDIAVATHYYNVEYIGQILNQVELLADVDRLIGLIQTQWELDVCDCRQQVVKYDPESEDYVAIVENLPEKLTKIRQKIEKRQQLKAIKAKQMEEWKVAHTSTATQTQAEPADVKNQTEAPQFADESQTPQEDEVVYHLADLPKEVQKMILLDDETYHLFHIILREEIMPLIKSNKNKYANLVRFICNLRRITNRYSDMPEWAELYKNIIPEVMPILSSMKQRKDANIDKNYKNYDDPKKCTNDDCWQLHRDGPEIEEILKPVIDRLAS